MPYEPRIDVLVDQPRAVRPPDLSLDGLLTRFPGIAATEAVCVTGSIVAGWGNVGSDVDLYVFSDADVELPVDPTMELWPGEDAARGVSWTRWIGRYGDACVDLAVWPVDTVAKLLAPFLADEEPELGGLGADLEDFIYRVSIARPLKGDAFLAEQTRLIRRSSYNRVLARTQKIRAENSLTDVAGQLLSHDTASARISATQAAQDTADCVLLLAGELTRRPKWLLRRLEATPACGITPEEYRREVLEGTRPGESEHDCALRLARWSQSHLIRVEDVLLTTGSES